MASPAILLDRDGVININRPDHVKCWSEFRFVPGALSALIVLSRLDLPIAIVSNQAIVSRGLISERQLDIIHERMLSVIQAASARVDQIFYCPHDAHEKCNCRKPEPGLLLNAAESLDLDLSNSVFVGDAFTDVQAGKRANCKTVLVLTGRGLQSMNAVRNVPALWPDAVALDLMQAIPVINRLLNAAPLLREPAYAHLEDLRAAAAIA